MLRQWTAVLPINPNLTRVQAEGGIAQGIGMTLTESVTYDDRGYPMENSLFQYKIPARVDIGKIRVEFENSYEGEGRSVRNPSARLLSIHRCRRFRMQSEMP